MRNHDAFDDYGYLVIAEQLESQRESVARERRANRSRRLPESRTGHARRSIWQSLFGARRAYATDGPTRPVMRDCTEAEQRSFGQAA